jgi:hypothetical protein
MCCAAFKKMTAQGVPTGVFCLPLWETTGAQTRQRVRFILEAGEQPVKSAPNNAYLESIRRLNEGQNGNQPPTTPAAPHGRPPSTFQTYSATLSPSFMRNPPLSIPRD